MFDRNTPALDHSTQASRIELRVKYLAFRVPRHIARSRKAAQSIPHPHRYNLNHDRSRLLRYIIAYEKTLNTTFFQPHSANVLSLMGQLSDLRSSLQALPNYTSLVRATAVTDLPHIINDLSRQPAHHHCERLNTSFNSESACPSLPVERTPASRIVSDDSMTDDEFVASLLTDGYAPYTLPKLVISKPQDMTSSENQAYFEQSTDQAFIK